MSWTKTWPMTSGKILLSYFNELALACLERRAKIPGASGLTLPSGLAGRDILYQEYTRMYDFITDIIPHYVNHTDSAGNWSNQAAIKMWSEADLLTYLSITRLPIPTEGKNPLPWYNQNQLILNTLIWGKYTLARITGVGYNQSKVGSGATFGAAQTAYAAASYANTSIANGGYGSGYYTSIQYTIRNTRFRMQQTDGPTSSSRILYCYGTALKGFIENLGASPNRVYDDLGNGYTENLLQLMLTESLATSLTSVYTPVGTPISPTDTAANPDVEGFYLSPTWAVADLTPSLTYYDP